MPSKLFSPLKIRELEFKNRIFVSPMCQYSAIDGVPQDWHLVHLGSRATGGAALVIAEATAVSEVGRISPGDTGIWNQDQVKAFRPITNFIRSQGSIAGIQLAHAGRKASTAVPWRGGQPLNNESEAWTTVAPSALPFSPAFPVPHELKPGEIANIVEEFASAAKNALEAGFEVAELHFAHGYLAHQFLSPLSNNRQDEFGGSLANRLRFPLQVARRVREIWPAKWPLFARISATDWAPGGWDLEQSLVLCRELKTIGVDLIDTSSGGNVAHAKIPVAPGYQVPFAQAIREGAEMLTGAVGLITEPAHAEEILANQRADAVFLARELLRDPYWPLHAAKRLGVEIPWPKQYDRARNY